jgi:hypothetical protein
MKNIKFEERKMDYLRIRFEIFKNIKYNDELRQENYNYKKEKYLLEKSLKDS